MALDTLTPLLNDHLHGQGRLRVWSLIVTILGDAVELRGGSVPTARLTALLDRLGVSMPAQRTALSRLVSDGWAVRAKDPRDGRATVYSLSEKGRAEFAPAARLVYAAPGSVTSGDWIVTTSTGPRGVMIAPGVGLWPADFAPRERGFSMVGRFAEIPDDMRAGIVTTEHEAETDALLALIRYLDVTFQAEDGLDAMAARTVLIHRWRRYVLRFPELPEALAPEGWAGLELRAQVAALYDRLLPLSDAWLSAPGAGWGALPPPSAAHFARFRNRPGDRK